MRFPAATLTIACLLLTLPGTALAKGGGHGGGGHGGGGHSGGHGGGGHSGHSAGHGSGGHHGGQTSSNSHAAASSTSASHRPSSSTGANARHRPGVGQPLSGTAVPRPPLPVTPPGVGGVAPLPSFPLFGLSGGVGFSSFAGWPIVYPSPLYVSSPTGGLRLTIEPPFAEVIIDGYYAGIAGDFSGRFHHLDLPPGSHHVELLAPGYEPLGFDLMIQAHHTIRFAATLAPAP